jgi:dipeptidyl aminopeptidase/acylaminoacyl peptidase
MLITTRFSDTAQVHRVSFPGGARTQLTFFHDGVNEALYQPTRGDYFLFPRDIGGNEFYQIYRFDLADGAVTLLTDGKSRNGGVCWSNSGERIAYTSTRRSGADMDIYVMDPMKPESDRLLMQVSGGAMWNVLDWSPDDRSLLAGEYISINESRLWLVDAVNGNKKALTPENKGVKAAYSNGLFSRDGKGIYIITDRDSEFLQLAYRDFSTGGYTYPAPGINWDVEHMALSRNGRTLAFVTNEAGISILHLFDIASGKIRTISSLPTGVITKILWHNNSKDLGVTLSSSRQPGDVFSVDALTQKAERWTQSETGSVDAGSFTKPELIRWKSFDGREITGFLYLPHSKFTGKRPVLINIHGGPESQFRPGYLGAINYYMRELGIAVIFPNIRGSSGYGKTYLTLDNGVKREDSYKDIAALLDWLSRFQHFTATG